MGNKNQTKQSVIIIRKIERYDIAAAVSLHECTISSAGARMGSPYLRQLYSTFFDHPTIHLIFGAFKNNQLVGIVSATNDFTKTSNLFNKRFLKLLPTIFSGLIRNRYSLIELFAHAKVDSQIKQMVNNSTSYILCLAVDSKIQRQGIATRLIQQVKKKCKTKTIMVDTQINNISAQTFYKKFGFVPIKSVADSIIFRMVL